MRQRCLAQAWEISFEREMLRDEGPVTIAPVSRKIVQYTVQRRGLLRQSLAHGCFETAAAKRFVDLVEHRGGQADAFAVIWQPVLFGLI